ncbi:MAG: DsbA family protein, partial [Methanobrevibacter sp.]|nr:DsbA family protein [Methanobrevibacter sp.]
MSKTGIEEGIDFKYATTLYTNTRDAHRLVQFAKIEKPPKIEEKLDKLLFDAYFTQNLKLSDENVLVKIGEDAGLEREETLEVLRSDKFNQEVIYDERLAL